MSDGNLLAFGCGVLMLALAGAYVALRARFWEHESGEPETVPVLVSGPNK